MMSFSMLVWAQKPEPGGPDNRRQAHLAEGREVRRYRQARVTCHGVGLVCSRPTSVAVEPANQIGGQSDPATRSCTAGGITTIGHEGKLGTGFFRNKAISLRPGRLRPIPLMLSLGLAFSQPINSFKFRSPG